MIIKHPGYTQLWLLNILHRKKREYILDIKIFVRYGVKYMAWYKIL